MIEEWISWFLNGFLGLGVGQIGLVVGLVATVLYWAKVQAAAAFLGSWIGKIVFALAVIGVLTFAGVIPTIRVSLAIDLLGLGWDLIWNVIEAILSTV